MAAAISMRLFVVWGEEPNNSLRWSPYRRIAAQPPGPGLPEQAPSVISCTFFIGSLRGRARQFLPEKLVHQDYDLPRLLRVEDLRPQARAVPDAVGEMARELLHPSD